MRPHVSILCWIADVMTAARFFLAGVIFAGTMMGDLPPFAVLVLFCEGEVLDALDGVWARHFLHPSWAGVLPFRKYAPLLDKAADLLLMGVTLLFILLRLKDYVFVGGATVFAVLALVIELNKARVKEWSYSFVRDEDFVILLRRGAYVILVCLTAMRLGDATMYSSVLIEIYTGVVFLYPAYRFAYYGYILGEEGAVVKTILCWIFSAMLLVWVPPRIASLAYSIGWARLLIKIVASVVILVAIARLKSDRASEENTPTPRAEA